MIRLIPGFGAGTAKVAEPEGRIRLTLLGGYLGSGKTTWLRHQLHAGTFGRVHVVVNEAAEIPVDDALLGGAAGLTVLAGGCVCCTGRGDLVAALRDLCDQRSSVADPGARIERIVLETSGLADPAPIVVALRADPILARHIVIGEIVVAVDAAHGLAQLSEDPLGRRQVEAADRLILTKLDAVRAEAIARLQLALRSLNPGATLSAAVMGSWMALPEVPPGTRPPTLPLLPDGDAEPLLPVRLSLGPEPDWAALGVWLSALLHARGDQIVRVKGVVQTPAGRLLLQTVRRVVQPPEILPAGEDRGGLDNGIVVIGRGFQPQALHASFRHFLNPTVP